MILIELTTIFWKGNIIYTPSAFLILGSDQSNKILIYTNIHKFKQFRNESGH